MSESARRPPPICVEPQSSVQAWKLIERDYTLRLSLVAHEWSAEHLRAWNAVFAEGRRRGNSAYYGPALVEMEIEDLDKRAEWSYRTCCEIWEIQGRTKSRSFFRAIFDSCLQPIFSSREAGFTSQVGLHQRRTALVIPQGLSAITGSMYQKISKLRSKWNTKLEIACRDAEHQERLRRKRESEQKSHEIRDMRERSFFEQGFPPRQSGGIGDHSLDGAVCPPFTWRQLEMRFRELRAKTSERRVSANFIRTEWDSGSVTEEWILGGSAVWRVEFEALASIAAQKLGWTQSKDASKYWLDHVREWMQQAGLDKDKSVAWLPIGTTVDSGLSGRTQGLYTEKIAELSAMFCMDLIARGTPESINHQVPQAVALAERTSTAKPLRTPSRRKLKIMRAVFAALQAHDEGLKYCETVDRYRPPVSQGWIDDVWPGSYAKAYLEPKWAKRIQDQKSKLRQIYDEMSVQQREQIIQGTSSTRQTR